MLLLLGAGTFPSEATIFFSRDIVRTLWAKRSFKCKCNMYTLRNEERRIYLHHHNSKKEGGNARERGESLGNKGR